MATVTFETEINIPEKIPTEVGRNISAKRFLETDWVAFELRRLYPQTGGLLRKMMRVVEFSEDEMSRMGQWIGTGSDRRCLKTSEIIHAIHGFVPANEQEIAAFALECPNALSENQVLVGLGACATEGYKREDVRVEGGYRKEYRQFVPSFEKPLGKKVLNLRPAYDDWHSSVRFLFVSR